MSLWPTWKNWGVSTHWLNVFIINYYLDSCLFSKREGERKGWVWVGCRLEGFGRSWGMWITIYCMKGDLFSIVNKQIHNNNKMNKNTKLAVLLCIHSSLLLSTLWTSRVFLLYFKDVNRLISIYIIKNQCYYWTIKEIKTLQELLAIYSNKCHNTPTGFSWAPTGWPVYCEHYRYGMQQRPPCSWTTSHLWRPGSPTSNTGPLRGPGHKGNTTKGRLQPRGVMGGGWAPGSEGAQH